jgi:hypothetical protein
MVTHDFRPGQLQFLPDHIGQRPSGLNLKTVRCAINLEGERTHRLALCDRRYGRLTIAL